MVNFTSGIEPFETIHEYRFVRTAAGLKHFIMTSAAKLYRSVLDRTWNVSRQTGEQVIITKSLQEFTAKFS